MESLLVKNIVESSRPLLVGYESFINIENEYVLGNGILINSDGEVKWLEPWEHDFFNAIYLKEQNVIITDRFAMPGACTTSFGICCIDMETGKYRWKHWSDDSSSERRAFRKEPSTDINMVRGIGRVDESREYIITKNFKIKISDGSYQHIESKEENEIHNKNYINHRLSGLHSYDHWNADHVVEFKINSVVISGKEIFKEGYFFTKCETVIDRDGYLYFFGVPAKRNNSGTILFKYSKENSEIESEIKMSFKSAPVKVCDFINKEIMIYEENHDKKTYNLWLVKI